MMWLKHVKQKIYWAILFLALAIGAAVLIVATAAFALVIAAGCERRDDGHEHDVSHETPLVTAFYSTADHRSDGPVCRPAAGGGSKAC